MEKRYLLVLSGQGDTSITVVDQEGWDYLKLPEPEWKGETSVDEKCPGVDEPVQVTIGSWDNDRAIHLWASDRYPTFDTLKQAMKNIKANNAELADEYHGCIY